jgi:hypothetical protein
MPTTSTSTITFGALILISISAGGDLFKGLAPDRRLPVYTGSSSQEQPPSATKLRPLLPFETGLLCPPPRFPGESPRSETPPHRRTCDITGVAALG